MTSHTEDPPEIPDGAIDEALLEKVITAIDPSGDPEDRDQWRGEAARQVRIFNVLRHTLPPPVPPDHRPPIPTATVRLSHPDPAVQVRIDAAVAEMDELARLCALRPTEPKE